MEICSDEVSVVVAVTLDEQVAKGVDHLAITIVMPSSTHVSSHVTIVRAEIEIIADHVQVLFLVLVSKMVDGTKAVESVILACSIVIEGSVQAG